MLHNALHRNNAMQLQQEQKMTNKQPQTAQEVFFDERNIAIGKGRILYGNATQTRDGSIVQEGWVLPGGKRTRNRDLAETVARNINLRG